MKKASIALLASIATAMAVAPGYALATEAQAKELIDGGFAEFNPEIKDGDKIAIRLTDAGLAKNGTPVTADDEDDTTTAPAAPAATSGFALIDNASLPGASRGGRNGPVYPFDDMNVGQSFFVPATADKPEPAKSIASTATSAAKRFATPVMNPATPKLNEDGTPVIENGVAVMNAPTPVMEEYKVKGVSKTREKIEYTRKFAVKTVTAGKVYGAWTAPSDGALVQRTA